MITPTLAVLQGIVEELSKIIDEKYPDEQFFALAPSMQKLHAAAEILSRYEMPLPEAYQNVLQRFQRHQN